MPKYTILSSGNEDRPNFTIKKSIPSENEEEGSSRTGAR